VFALLQISNSVYTVGYEHAFCTSEVSRMTDYSGMHDMSAAVRNALAGFGVLDPYTGQPFTESMLLGIGGGLGAGYLLFQWAKHNAAVVVIGFRNRWNYNVDYFNTLMRRLNVTCELHETSGVKGAAGALQEALMNGVPVVTWTDKANLPYQHQPERMKGYQTWIVTVHAFDGATAQVADCAADLWTISAADLAAARGQIPSDKNRIGVVRDAEPMDVQAAIHAGIADHIEHLSRDSETFSLPVYKKWSKLLTDKKNKKSWHVAFSQARSSLLDALSMTYEEVRHNNDGLGLRKLYADFLKDAAEWLDNPRLNAAADAYHDAAEAWRAFGDASIGAFPDRARTLQARYQALHRSDAEAVRQCAQEIEAQREAANARFPLSDADLDDVYRTMAAKLDGVYQAERAALEALKQAITL
jgi:hypothetical protein